MKILVDSKLKFRSQNGVKLDFEWEHLWPPNQWVETNKKTIFNCLIQIEIFNIKQELVRTSFKLTARAKINN